MHRFVIAAIALFVASAAAGAEPADNQAAFPNEPYAISTDAITPTPEMWFYLQEQQRHDDPKAAVRRKAELRAAQRRNRLAAMKWYGLSNQRPRANPTPWFGVYSPMWVANLWEPYRWVGLGTPAVIVLNGLPSPPDRP